MIAAATRWFDNNRSLRFRWCPRAWYRSHDDLADGTLADFHLRLAHAMMTVGVIAWVLLIPAALLVKQPPETASSGEPARNGSIASEPACPSVTRSARRNSRSWR